MQQEDDSCCRREATLEACRRSFEEAEFEALAAAAVKEEAAAAVVSGGETRPQLHGSNKLEANTIEFNNRDNGKVLRQTNVYTYANFYQLEVGSFSGLSEIESVIATQSIVKHLTE